MRRYPVGIIHDAGGGSVHRGPGREPVVTYRLVLPPDCPAQVLLPKLPIDSTIIFFVLNIIVGLRPSVDVEREGLDIAEPGERAYHA